GEIGFHDSRTLLISGTKSVTGLDIADFSSTVVNLSDIIPDGDYIVNMAVDSRYGFCVIYRDGDTDNLVIYDLLGNLIDTVTLSSVESDDISADPDSAVPFDIAGRPIIEYCRGGNILVATDKTAYFYNTGEKSCLYGGNPVAHGETSGIQLSLYSLVPQIDSMGKVHSDMYMVVQRSADNADCIVFDKRVLGCTLHPKEIYYSDNGPVLRCRRTGMKMNLDFRNEKIDTIGYSITDDMLMEKLYVSADRGYRIYGYAPENHSGITAYNFALKQLSTGKTCYIGCAGLINGSYSGEAGFLPDGRVYVLGDNDYCIYSTDINDHQPQFVLSDHIDLGENVNTDLEDRILVAAMSDQNGMITAVYYDIKNEEENNFIDDKGLRLKSCYKVAIFDASGRLLRYYNTPLNAVAGYNPVNIYQIGNSLTITVTYQGTGTVISKGVLNYSNNMFTATVMDNPV
ncbi:MAG: hypothetical protein IJD80_07005, partial [Oscillospiraceae bacterium]|nr:hypothetical protein [Oscillospiraceae bacterium]